jgi:mRNA-degrading endonuclease RelE of RelBE toxin-antitoxin system
MRFQDVYRKIKNTKEFVINEGKRINGTLLAFQNKYDKELQELDQRHQKQHEDFKQETRENFVKRDEECKRLDGKIDVEKEERVKQAEENYNKIASRIDGTTLVTGETCRRISTAK